MSSGLYFANHSQLPWGNLSIGSEAFSHLGEGMHFSAKQKKKKREKYPRILVGGTQAHPHDAG